MPSVSRGLYILTSSPTTFWLCELVRMDPELTFKENMKGHIKSNQVLGFCSGVDLQKHPLPSCYTVLADLATSIQLGMFHRHKT